MVVGMRRISIIAARKIAKDYGYDQVIIYARKIGDDPDPHGEHLTTYGIDKTLAARIGEHLKNDIFKWENDK